MKYFLILILLLVGCTNLEKGMSNKEIADEIDYCKSRKLGYRIHTRGFCSEVVYKVTCDRPNN